MEMKCKQQRRIVSEASNNNLCTRSFPSHSESQTRLKIERTPFELLPSSQLRLIHDFLGTVHVFSAHQAEEILHILPFLKYQEFELNWRDAVAQREIEESRKLISQALDSDSENDSDWDVDWDVDEKMLKAEQDEERRGKFIAKDAPLLKNSRVVHLALSRSNIRSQICIALVNALKNNLTIKSLSLAHNSIGDKGGIALCQLLENANRLDSLNLEECGLEKKSGKALAKALKSEHCNLYELEIADNFF